MFNFGEWVVKVAINGVKANSFSKEWAGIQLADFYARGMLLTADLENFDKQMADYEAEKINNERVDDYDL